MKEETKSAIDAFIAARPNCPMHMHNCWIRNDEIKLYLRVGLHAVGKKAYRFLDLANIDVHEPGHGLFTEILKHLQAVTPYSGIFVEAIVNERLMEHMKRLQEKDPRWVQRDGSFAWIKNEVTHRKEVAML